MLISPFFSQQGQVLRDCAAPAKLNLFLHVTGRRPDGYHLLQSAFQLIDWHDTLHFQRRDDGLIQRNNIIPGVEAEQDLCIRAARLLQTYTKTAYGVEITVEKRLPMGGGLGGGSSDAATTLLALNRLWRLDLPRTELMQLGISLGADVPFFLLGSSAFAEGIGEHLQAIHPPVRHFAIIAPSVHVPTAVIFSDQDLTRDTPPIKITDFLAHQDLFAFGHNDLEPIAAGKHLEIAQAVSWLKRFCNYARMTGSGSCVFASFSDQASAKSAIADLPAGWTGCVASSLNKHPLADFAS